MNETDEKTRREFFTSSCQGASAAAIIAFLQGCGGGGSPSSPGSSAPPLPTIDATVANGTIALTIDAASPLAAVGGAALVQTSSGRFLVARTGQDAFVAFTATCTHEGCTITGYASPRFVCPCHGSNFDTSGRPVSGPASRALQQFSTSFVGNVVSIAL